MFGYLQIRNDLNVRLCLDILCQNCFWVCKRPKWILTYLYVYRSIFSFL